MTAALVPIVPEGHVYDAGQITFPATAIEIESDFKHFVESCSIDILPMYRMKYRGGAKAKKYKVQDSNLISIDIMLVGTLPRRLHERLYELAIAVNGGGMPLNFYDDFIMGSESSPVTRQCRWVNAGDFVENNVLLNGGSIELMAYDTPLDIPTTAYQEVIDSPTSGLYWIENINHATAYQEVIG